MKRLFSAFAALALIMVFIPMSTPAAALAGQKTYRVGFAQDTLANDWRIAQVRALEQEFAKHPDVDFFYTNAKGQTARQIQDIEDMIHMNVDVLITSPRDATLMAPVISRAYQSGIPVILISRRIDSDDFTIFIHPDNRRIARQSARYIAERLSGTGKVFILQHIPTTTPAIERTEGFMAEIKTHPGISVVGVKVANSLRADAIRRTEEALAEGLSFDAIYAQSDSMASGARLALKKAGIDPAGVIITGIDYISEAREAILAGEQDASFTYPTGGKEGAAFAMKILNGETVPKEFVIDSVMVTRENADAVSPIF